MRTTVRNSYTPKTGDYCNMIVVDNDNGVQYIFDSDGVWTPYTSKNQEGAPMSYVNAKANEAYLSAKQFAIENDALTLQAAKDYTDQHVPSGAATVQYVNEQDALTLQAAKDYTDAHSGQGGVSQQYVDDQDAATLTAAKNYADTQDGSLHNTITGEISTALNNLHTTITGEIASGDYATISMTDTDPGEGVALAVNHFIAVYSGSEESE